MRKQTKRFMDEKNFYSVNFHYNGRKIVGKYDLDFVGFFFEMK